MEFSSDQRQKKTQQEIARNLVSAVSGDIRIKFGVLEGMTPTRAIKMAEAVESLLLDHISHCVDVRSITNDEGFLTPRQGE